MAVKEGSIYTCTKFHPSAGILAVEYIYLHLYIFYIVVLDPVPIICNSHATYYVYTLFPQALNLAVVGGT